LRKRYPLLRVLVLSIHDEPVLARQLLASGIAGVVLKRSAVTDLVPAIREVLKGGVYVSRGVQGDAGGIQST
jgi:DNA-binding NarL/FixJ family response regulator